MMRGIWLGLLCLVPGFLLSQELPGSNSTGRDSFLDFTPFYGSVLLHNTDISHLITHHPRGFILGWNTRTYGEEAWQSDFGYPDKGLSLIYQDMGNPVLGELISLYAHYNFYFFRRQFQLRIGQGVAYATNPYDRETNFRNNAYGSRLTSSTYLMAQYARDRIWGKLGMQAGISLIHYSNANVKAPNTSTNTFALSLGLRYDLGQEDKPEYQKQPYNPLPDKYMLNLVFRTGINESDVIGSGQFPFYIASAYGGMRIGRKSTLQLGADFFASNFLKELIQFQATSFPELDVDPDTDFKRVGLFLGHELAMGKLGIVTQFGYYVYYPFDFEGRTYNRVGIKRYFGQRLFAGLSLKSHGAKAEAVELGIGIRL